MNDSSGKTSSCLAITEKKKKQRPGGCIGLFFQLFDWNGKLAKKKLFSKKLLPPARAKQASKKFKGDEKMPNSKLHLIANENRGGFPSAKKSGNRSLDLEPKHDMRVPGLVARLMGLESIPTAQRDKSEKASCSGSCGNVKDESRGNHCESDRQVGNLEMRIARHDSRPQKLQKTGTYERKAMAKFGAEALQIKSVFSRARKHNNSYHHHPKLASHLKGPKINSGKNTSRSSRLIGAATKILEPGLQATSRAKCSLTYPSSTYAPKIDVAADRVMSKSANVQSQSRYDANASKPLMGSGGKASCKNCGNVLDVVDRNLDAEEHPTVPLATYSEVITTSCLAAEQRNVRSLMTPHEHDSDVVLLRPQRHIASNIVEDGRSNAQRKVRSLMTPHEQDSDSNAQSGHELSTRKMPPPHEVPVPWNSLPQPCSTLEHDASSVSFRHKSQTQEQIISSERTSPGSKVSRTKDFVALNRSLSGRSRLRSPNKIETSKFDLERKPCNRQVDSLPRVRTMERKRRIPSIALVESTASVNSAVMKQRNARCDALGGKGRDISASSFDSINVKLKQGSQGKSYKSPDKVNDVVSFAFNSPLKHKTGMTTKKDETCSKNEISTYSQQALQLTGDVLAAFLEQKLRELTTQEDERLPIGGPPKKSPAMILQELISALSAEQLTCHYGHIVNVNKGFHGGAQGGSLVGASCNVNHLCPGSVLEASFSSSSLDESSGHDLHTESMNYSYDQLEYDSQLVDSVAPLDKGKIGSELLHVIVNQISMILQSLSSFGITMRRGKPDHVKDVILDAELLFGSTTTTHSEDSMPHLFVSRFLLDELDTMADDDALWIDFNGSVGCRDSKERSQFKGFLFDSVVEYLESNCCTYCNCGFRTWTKLPLSMNAGMLVQEVKRVVKKWACMAVMIPDEIIEWEMSHSRGKWTDFDVEAFEAGVEIDGEILQILVDEIVKDLVDCGGMLFESLPRCSC
ncbi:uncharacterized protein LOC114759469 [Neltuma alba]|uniref:uncharacterized protein LOC114736344 n=1 Tax=Neltuma alba TaxID=207710 RepID=UPI0010A56816|nr:uncharacterized protein LOC114736344 [Prosopis alba]XP_028804479.1 uncharacterized protein LOC114759469 [Prosopis alba]